MQPGSREWTLLYAASRGTRQGLERSRLAWQAAGPKPRALPLASWREDFYKPRLCHIQARLAFRHSTRHKHTEGREVLRRPSCTLLIPLLRPSPRTCLASCLSAAASCLIVRRPRPMASQRRHRDISRTKVHTLQQHY